MSGSSAATAAAQRASLSSPGHPAPSSTTSAATPTPFRSSVTTPPKPSPLSSLCDPHYPPISVESYSAFVGSGLLSALPSRLPLLTNAAQYVLISDSNVFPLYGPTLLTAFASNPSLPPLHHLILPPGESSKTRHSKALVEDFLLSRRCGRDTCLLALGGGVIGDLVGFVAATYMRGIPYIHLPTSLLAMVDSSIGGKTGIDAPRGKNLIGAFWRPLAVIIDVSLLTTLPLRELSNGLAESIKAGAIADESLFAFIEGNCDRLLARDLPALTEVIYRSVAFKARVVTADEREGGQRAILNFGHSIGHAIEAVMLPELLHGECVAIGMMEEALLARSLGLITSATLRRLDRCLTAFALPTRVPSACAPTELLERMGVDKKNKGGKKEVVMLTGIGSVKSDPWTTTVSDAQLLTLLTPAITLDPALCSPSGHVSVPGSKSLSNRILLLSAMGRGPCRVRGLLHSQDTQVMLDSLRELGVKFAWEERQTVLVMQGSGGVLTLPSKELYLGNAGTASRFLTSLVTVVKAGEVTLTGNARMKERPIADLVDALRANGCKVEYTGKDGCLPIRVRSVGGFPGGEVTLRANISSQYVSSILLSAAHALQAVTLRLEGDAGVVSKPFIDMTLQLMRKFNIHVNESSPLCYQIPKGGYDNPPGILVEGDASSATYPLALAAVSGGEVTVDNVGSDSLQGDSAFCQVLQRMGCTVTQDPMRTTVKGPKALGDLRAIDIDMDSMTDTFMTLAAVAAFAVGTTRITNIANQRVKECNRLQVMVEELRKVGVRARETETGMEVIGCGGCPPPLPAEVTVDCHDDHRIAMSFSIIACRVAGVVIDDKRCVDKTYPEYWDHLTQYLHCATSVPRSALLDAGPAPGPPPRVVVIIGMRGAGKTTLGRSVAAALSYNFVDVDDLITARVGNIRQFVEREGWPAFRALETTTFSQALESAADTTIIATGGGLVESEDARLRLQRCAATVVWLHRDITDIAAYLKEDTTRPAFDPIAVFETRRRWYEECSRFEYHMAAGDVDWTRTAASFLRFVRHVLGLRQYTVGEESYFLSLTFPDVTPALPYLGEMTEGVDAIELRVDLLDSYDLAFIKAQLAALRQHGPLPIIWTVRTAREGGRYEGGEKDWVALLLLGLRLGCEYIDVEVKSGGVEGRKRVLAAKGQSLIIGSCHRPKDNGGTPDEIRATLHATALGGQADVQKVVVSASTVDDALRLMHVVEGEKSGKPVIALAMGEAGKVSRALNRHLTPVTHPLLPNAAAPGQLTVRDIMAVKCTLGVIPAKHFYLFGSPITHSPSPLLHNTAFGRCGYPWVYSKVETIEIDRVAEVVRGSSFGGASVTIPLKEQVGVLCQALSPAAQRIGAVNTLVRRADGTLYGDNTDWLGIYRLLHPLIPSLQPSDSALVIGAGGTARAALYALIHLGFSGQRLLVHNPRTAAKGEALAAEFTGVAVGKVEVGAQGWGARGLRVVVATLPDAAGWEAGPGVLGEGVVVLDANYAPYKTKLIAQAEKAKAVVVRGLDMLLEQGMAQFEVWTGRSGEVIRDVVEDTVREAYKKQWIDKH